MQFLTLAMFCAVTAGEFLVRLQVLNRYLTFLPELFSAVFVVYAVIAGVQQRFRLVKPQYWLVFGLMLVVIVCGVVANSVETGPLVAGIRAYFKAIPLFFLPAVLAMQDRRIRQQLLLLLGIALVQIPIAIAQRWIVMKEHRFTGDPVSGTLLISSILSIFLICAVCVLTGLYLRKRISKLVYYALVVLLLIPTTINETKGTLILLPLGLLVTFLVGSPRGKRTQIVVGVAMFVALFGAVFAPIYDYMNRNKPYAIPITEFMTRQDKLEGYLDRGAEVGTTEPVGRVDAIVVPLQQLAKDPVQLVFGYGIGNASRSALGEQFTGKYAVRFGPFAITSASTFLLEIGLLGTGLVLLLYWMIFRDALAVARLDDGVRGALAIGWTGVTVIVALATAYKTTYTFESLSYLFWYFSGMIAARRMQFALAPSPSGSKLRETSRRSRPRGTVVAGVR